jgi:hypothetical protein
MQINAPRGLEDPVKLDQTNGHHDEIRHHVIATEEGKQRLHQVRELPGAAGYDFLVHRLGLHAPLPRILKRHDLRGGFFAALFLEEHVVGGVGVEGRVEVNQVNAGVRDVVAKNVQVIAKLELVFAVHLRRAYHILRA